MGDTQREKEGVWGQISVPLIQLIDVSSALQMGSIPKKRHSKGNRVFRETPWECYWGQLRKRETLIYWKGREKIFAFWPDSTVWMLMFSNNRISICHWTLLSRSSVTSNQSPTPPCVAYPLCLIISQWWIDSHPWNEAADEVLKTI